MEEKMFKWLASFKCNSLHLGRDADHACNYVSAKEWIEEFSPEWFEHCSEAELLEMKATNTIWSLQIYPDTPIGSYAWYGPTMESVVRKAMEHFQPEAVQPKPLAFPAIDTSLVEGAGIWSRFPDMKNGEPLGTVQVYAEPEPKHPFEPFPYTERS